MVKEGEMTETGVVEIEDDKQSEEQPVGVAY
jgi:hypothetical protein